MPARYLSDVELARLSTWPGEIAEEDAVTFFTLAGADLRWARGSTAMRTAAAEGESSPGGWRPGPRATGDGPKAIFADGLAWLRERKVLLPGVTTLARLVASVRDEATRQMWEDLARLPDPAQRRALDRLPEVPHGAWVSDLERWRRGPAPRGSGQSVAKYLDQIAEISGLGLGKLGIEALVPPRRLAELARYGTTASASLILKLLPAVITFGASAEGALVLAAMQALLSFTPQAVLQREWRGA